LLGIRNVVVEHLNFVSVENFDACFFVFRHIVYVVKLPVVVLKVPKAFADAVALQHVLVVWLCWRGELVSLGVAFLIFLEILQLQATRAAFNAALNGFPLGAGLLVDLNVGIILVVHCRTIKQHPCAGESRMGPTNDHYSLHFLLFDLFHCGAIDFPS